MAGGTDQTNNGPPEREEIGKHIHVWYDRNVGEQEKIVVETDRVKEMNEEVQKLALIMSQYAKDQHDMDNSDAFMDQFPRTIQVIFNYWMWWVVEDDTEGALSWVGSLLRGELE